MFNSLLYSHLYRWYESNRRVLPWRETENAYFIWLSEVILQQTRVSQGMEYYLRFVSRWPTVEELARADESEVLRAWQGLGYYSRARNLHKAAQMIVERGWSPFPTRYEDIRSLPGIGDYTAGAIASFAYDQAYPAMDGNVYRVIARLFDIDEPFDTTSGKKLFREKLEGLLDREHPRLFNSAIMEFGALQCTPDTQCPPCPLKEFCLSYAHGTSELLPVRKPRPKLRDRWLTYYVYVQRDKGQGTKDIVLIRRRENPKDIWYHLYEFPCEESNSPGTVQQQATPGSYNTSDLTAKRSYNAAVYPFTHTLSHQRLHARVIIKKVEELPAIEGAVAVSWSDLDDFALSRLTLRVIDTVKPKLRE